MVSGGLLTKSRQMPSSNVYSNETDGWNHRITDRQYLILRLAWFTEPLPENTSVAELQMTTYSADESFQCNSCLLLLLYYLPKIFPFKITSNPKAMYEV